MIPNVPTPNNYLDDSRSFVLQPRAITGTDAKGGDLFADDKNTIKETRRSHKKKLDCLPRGAGPDIA